MIRWDVMRAVAALALCGTAACSHVGSSTSGLNTVTGEAWYVRSSNFLGIPVSTSVWYCAPPSDRPGHPVCQQAKLHDVGDESEAMRNRRPASDLGASEGSSQKVIYAGDKDGERDDKEEGDAEKPAPEQEPAADQTEQE